MSISGLSVLTMIEFGKQHDLSGEQMLDHAVGIGLEEFRERSPGVFGFAEHPDRAEEPAGCFARIAEQFACGIVDDGDDVDLLWERIDQAPRLLGLTSPEPLAGFNSATTHIDSCATRRRSGS